MHYLHKAGRINSAQVRGEQELDMPLDYYDDRITVDQRLAAMRDLERWVNASEEVESSSTEEGD